MLKPFCAALAAFAVATPASAAVFIVNYQGFASGRALDGAFGSQTQFENVAYVAAFTIDTSLGSVIPVPDATVVEGTGPTSPILAASIEIGGVRRDVAPTFGRLRLDPADATVSYIIESRIGGLTLFQLATQFAAPPTSFEEVPDGVIGGAGSFLWYDHEGRELASLTLTATELVIAPPAVTPPAPVPEPASWALMILGFAGAGGALRKRRFRVSARPASGRSGA